MRPMIFSLRARPRAAYLWNLFSVRRLSGLPVGALILGSASRPVPSQPHVCAVKVAC